MKASYYSIHNPYIFKPFYDYMTCLYIYLVYLMFLLYIFDNIRYK